jgi:ParB-like chromosome segregation protein Spo0J
MEEEDLARLAFSISQNGQDEDIVLYEDKILDGRNRYRACLRAGVEPRFRDLRDDEMPPLAFAWRRNRERLHSSTSQLAMDAIKVLPLLEEEEQNYAKKKAAQEFPANLRETPGDSRESRETGRPPSFAGGKTVAEASQITGISTRSLESARKVKEKGTPKLTRLVEDGKTTVDVAAKAADLPPEQQEEFVEKVEAGEKPREALKEVQATGTGVKDAIGLDVPEKHSLPSWKHDGGPGGQPYRRSRRTG